MKKLLAALVMFAGAAAWGATYTVTTANNSGPGSLREAITLANLNPGVDVIDFAIPPIGALATISLSSPLPIVTDPVMIDGYSQTGVTCPPGIELDGFGAGVGAHGLTLQATGCTIFGLVINGFRGNGIQIQGGGNNVIRGNYIGTDTNGLSERGNLSNGVFITNSTDNAIGVTPLDRCENRNIISGNRANGVMIVGAASTRNTIQNNNIGTDVDGAAALPNGTHGVMIAGGANGNNVGTMAAPKPVNIISGNATNGVYIAPGTSGNEVLGNHIGVARNGAIALGNGLNGIFIRDSGGNQVGDSAGEGRNVISANGGDGIRIAGGVSIGNMVEGNYIGIASNGFAALPNAGSGVLITGPCTQNRIGGTSGDNTRNIISGNAGSGVRIEDNAFGNFVFGNYIGLNRDGLAPVSNQMHGVHLTTRAVGNFIGQGSLTNTGNHISGNGESGDNHGILLDEFAERNEIARNTIGLAVDASPIGNKGAGIRVMNCSSNLVGGSSKDAMNVVSGNKADGIFMGPDVMHTVVLNNRIGTDNAGTFTRGNGGNGILIEQSMRNVIGTNNAGNLISANLANGVAINDARENSVSANFIGTDVSGTLAMSNSMNGIHIIQSSSNTVGGARGGNIISGNGLSGVLIEGDRSEGNMIHGNIVGGNVAGTTGVGNGQDGISLSQGIRNSIGGIGPAGNIVIGNARYGIGLFNAHENLVLGNRIGISGFGIGIPNNHSGVMIHIGSSQNTIGGVNPMEGNEIAYHPQRGITVLMDNSTNNAILGNSIHNNVGLGIDLAGDGVTPNDDLDPDLGSNFRQNYPVLYSATTGSVHIGGGFNSIPNTEYRIEFFRGTNGHYTGYGQGQFYLGYTNVKTEADGNVSNCFIVSFPDTVDIGDYITATATDPFGNTSEFSQWIRVVPNAEYDPDGDGMPSDWEIERGLDPESRIGDDGADGDPDGDGAPNFDEYVADTDPHSADSILRFTLIERPDLVEITYSSTNTRYYLVGYTADPSDGASWANLYSPAIQGDNGTTTTNDAAIDGPRVYRVRAQMAP